MNSHDTLTLCIVLVCVGAGIADHSNRICAKSGVCRLATGCTSRKSSWIRRGDSETAGALTASSRNAGGHWWLQGTGVHMSTMRHVSRHILKLHHPHHTQITWCVFLCFSHFLFPPLCRFCLYSFEDLRWEMGSARGLQVVAGIPAVPAAMLRTFAPYAAKVYS